MYAGWHQVAFRREIEAPLTAVSIGAQRLMLVDDGGPLRAYDATCPHRGAHLAHGGTLDAAVVVCPFHGRRIALGEAGPGPLRVCAHPTLDFGGAVFVLPSGHHDTGLAEYLATVARTHCFVPAFTLDVPVPPEIVIENVFDTDHFTAVHAVSRRPSLDVSEGSGGELVVEAVFETAAARPWGGEATATVTRTRFFARVFSPGLVATEVGDSDQPQVVITAATARPDGGCTVRVTLAVRDSDDEPAERALIMSLAQDSRLAFEQDIAIWEHLDADAEPHLDEVRPPGTRVPRVLPGVRPVTAVRELGEGLAGRVRGTAGAGVLWVHGYTMDSRVWDEPWDALAGCRHIGVDLPGHGASPPVDHGDLPAVGRRLARLARAHRARHLVALSFGTMFALQAAIEDPGAFASITLAAPALAGGPEDPAARIRYMQLAELHRRFGPGPYLTGLWLQSPPHIFTGLRACPERFERIGAVIAGHGWSELGNGDAQRLAARPQRPADLAAIAAPVLLLRGDGELPAFVHCAAIVRDAVPDAREVVLEGLGHLCLLEAPERAAAVIAGHLAAADRPTPSPS